MSLASTPSSPRSAKPLHLVLKPSKGLRIGLGMVHGLALVAALANDWPLVARCLLSITVLLSFWHYRRVLFLDPEITGLTVAADGAVFVKLKTGIAEAELGADCVVTPWLVILPLYLSGRCRSVLVCRDGVDAESFRALRVYLHCRGGHPQERRSTVEE